MPVGLPREIHHERRYRLLARPPFTVSFPSVTYELVCEPVCGAPQWRLEARSLTGRPWWTLIQTGEHRALLERAMFETGFELSHPTAATTILEQLVRDGRAERLDAPPRPITTSPAQTPSSPPPAASAPPDPAAAHGR